MEKDSALYQLMDTRMNGVMNDIVNDDGKYQAILRKSDEYSGRLDGMPLSQEVRLLIDGYVSEQNALGSRYGIMHISVCLAASALVVYITDAAFLLGENIFIIKVGQMDTAYASCP